MPYEVLQNDVVWLRLDGSPAVRVTTTTDLQESPISWLPNGRIGFEFASIGASGVATVNESGGERQLLTLSPFDFAGARDIAWSPTGRKIAYRARNRIYVANADGTDGRAITRYSQNALEPSWSPDGRRIAFASYGPSQTRGIYVMRSDGTHARRVAIGSDPAWSPDGSKLVYTHDDQGRNGLVQRLYVKDLRTKQPGKPLP